MVSWIEVSKYDENSSNDGHTFDHDDGSSSSYSGYECDSMENGCEHLCKLVSGEPTCFCEEGYELHDVTNCLDIDECAQEDNGGCEHQCVNKPGTYACK